MKFIVALTLMLISMPLLGQDTLREYYENGQLRVEYPMRNGQYEGLCKRWHPNGNLASSAYFSNGKSNGPSESWYENGRVEMVSLMLNGYGMQEKRYDTSGRLLFLFSCSQKRTVKKSWAPNGQLIGFEKFRNDIPIYCIGTIGPPDDTTVTETTCYYLGQSVTEKNGVFQDSTGRIIRQRYHGRGRTWNEQGRLRGRYFYRNGEMAGTWTVWDDDGKIIYKELYRKGILKKDLLE